jgi:hypothetical protein
MTDRRWAVKALTLAGVAIGGVWAVPAVAVAKPPCAAAPNWRGTLSGNTPDNIFNG